ncbi:hypothetical protein Pmani_002449 [Petrolisthes manimaculis]|uniref:C2H2-type domain-containing protein n=1 Tax=Petrolisthes manimaculis TaxID=1843537 RepID=A0AAE1QI06_9EUCA|nr:hypothetical protein Pmani_002449 [Petrolisthes manimaculis]
MSQRNSVITTHTLIDNLYAFLLCVRGLYFITVTAFNGVMIMAALRGVGGASSPHTSSTKRSFDVAFLTGAHDTLQSDVPSPAAKVSRVGGLKVSPPSVVRSPGVPPSPPRDDPTPGSAFTKVTRSQGSSPPCFSAANTLDVLTSSWPPHASASISSLLGGNKSLAPLLAAPCLLPPGLAPFLPHAIPDRLNNNLVEEYLKSQHTLLESKHISDMSASEALSRLRSSMYPTDPYKLPFSSLAYPFTPPSQSEVSKLGAAAPFLPPPSVSALMPPTYSTMAQSAQNVCAKCNISFRMTSDLVYHMRSQHKREADPYKKRRNERLKCTICGETFRERHHLTRHMSAHQDRDGDGDGK